MDSKTFSDDWLDANAEHIGTVQHRVTVIDLWAVPGVGIVNVLRRGDSRTILAPCEPEEIIERFNAAKAEKMTGAP